MKNNKLQKGGADIFVILLGIIIALLMFGYFRDQRLPSLNLFNFNQNQIGTNDKLDKNGLNIKSQFSACGINVTSPYKWDTINNIFQLSGSVNGCGWNIQNGFIGTFELVDAKTNKSLTDKVSIPVDSSGQFKATIALKNTPDSSVGYVLITGFNQSQEASFNVYLKK